MAETDVVDKTENQESNVSKDSLDIEARATALGWVAADKFRGAPEKHVDAKTYLDKGELVLPLVKKQRDEARQGLDKVSKELAEVKSTMSEFQKLIEADADRKVKEQIALLKEAKATAVEAGDKVGFQKAEDALDEVREAQAKVKEKPAEKKVESDPEFDVWRAENTWYDSDQDKKVTADQLGLYLHNVKKLSRSEVLKEVAKRMVELEAEASGTQRTGPQRGGQASGANGKAKTFDNLLPEFKQGFSRLERSGIKITKESYVAKCGSEAWGQ